MRSDVGPFLDVAAAIARRIRDSAIWFDGRCNWMGAVPVDESQPPGTHAIQAALGPDLYAGTSGVALFLAEAAVKLDDQRIRATALGAIRHALDHTGRIPEEVRDGLYAGPIGIAYAATRVAQLLQTEVALAGAREVLREWERKRVPSPGSDIVGGCAGATAGLVALGELLDDTDLVETATTLGEELIGRANISPAGWSWPLPRRRRMHDLCGFAHGSAGIGHALLELYGVTGEGRFRRAGERAFDYERSWFEDRTGTWPDLRGVGRRAGRDSPAPPSDSWCHGAPGIALSRVRATEILGDGTHGLDADADAALAATERVVSGVLSAPSEDFSLCHGAAGAADVLLYSADRRNGYELASKVGLLGIERHHRPEASFPCGSMPGGQTPGLFLGLAGIGLFYLRLADVSVPTPLIVGRRKPA